MFTAIPESTRYVPGLYVIPYAKLEAVSQCNSEGDQQGEHRVGARLVPSLTWPSHSCTVFMLKARVEAGYNADAEKESGRAVMGIFLPTFEDKDCRKWRAVVADATAGCIVTPSD
jgi:hypothetical protein